MWSPSPSVTTIDFNYNTTTTIPTNFNYHHEAMFYPSACIICGLPHHPVPHTLMQQKDYDHNVVVAPAIATPAPSESVHPPSSPKSIKSKTNRRFARQQQKKKHRSYNKRLMASIRTVFIKFIKMISIVPKAPSIRRHNIYPIIKRESSGGNKQ
jgi:hypothetical protein